MGRSKKSNLISVDVSNKSFDQESGGSSSTSSVRKGQGQDTDKSKVGKIKTGAVARFRARFQEFRKSRWFRYGIRSAIVVVLLFSLYLVLSPFIPFLRFKVSDALRSDEFYPYATRLEGRTEDRGIPSDNRLVIPAIGVDVNISEGQTDEALRYGAWRRPLSSTPSAGGNTVITGHRFQYLPPNNTTFYNLDKVEVGDRFIVYWEGTEYDYEVVEIKVVDPTEVEIEANTEDSRVTLYTCTPLWTADKRLVVTGKLMETQTEQEENLETSEGQSEEGDNL